MPSLPNPAKAALALSAALIATSSAEVLLNGTFEAGATDWALLGQNLPNGVVEVSTTCPATGTNHARMAIDNTSNPISPALIFQQTLPVGSIDGTQLYDFSVDAKMDSNDFTGIAVFAIVHFLDQDASDGGGVKSTSFNTLHTMGLNNSYQTFTFTDLDPTPGADSVQIILQLAPGPILGIQNAFNVDNVSLVSQGGGGSSTPNVDIECGTVVSWTPTDPLNCYQPQSSTDNTIWSDLGPVFKGTGTTSTFDPAGAPFHRVVEIEILDLEAEVNGSFEDVDGMCPTGWACLGSQPATQFTGDARTGAASARILVQNDVSGIANTSEIQQNLFLAGSEIIPGGTYELSFFAKQISTGVSYVQQFQFLFIDADDNTIPGFGVTFKPFSAGSGSWTETTETGIVAPPNAVSALLQINGVTGAVAGSSAMGEVLIDDVTISGTAPAPSTTDVAQNGSFELTDAIDPFCAEGWICGGSEPANQWNVDPRTGGFSMALFIDDTMGPSQTSEASQDVAAEGGTIDPGKVYTLSFWAYEVTNSGSWAQEYSVEWRDAGNNPLGGGIVATAFTGGNNDWQYVEATPVAAPATATTAVISLLASTGPDAGPSGGEVRIDDLSFTTPNPATILTATSSDGVRLTWDTLLGSTYQPKSSSTLSGFANFGSPIVGDGNPASVTDPKSGPQQYYQIDITP